MKTIKSILIATTLICASLVSMLSAQEAQAQKHEFKVAVGDSVMIKRECTKYLTGETPSVWVWDKVHTVRQLGTKRFPDGVLLMNILSWVCEDCLVPVNEHAQEEADKAAAEQAVDREKYEAQSQAEREAEAEKAEAERRARKAAADKAAAEQAEMERKAAEEVAADEAARKAAEEQAAAEHAEMERKAAEEAAADQAAAEEAARKAAEQAAAEAAAAQAAAEEAAKAAQGPQGDSIHSKQDFRHHYDRFTIGVRGGAASLLHNAEKGNWTCGGNAVLDLQYAHYWTKDGRPVDLGLIVGLGIGYMQSGLAANDSTAFTKANVDYTVIAKNIKETDHQLQLEVPLMFSLIHQSGLFFNVGPKFMIPVYTPFNQTANQDETHISAYFPEYGITVVDNEVTGKYTGQQPTGENGIQFNVNVMLTAEIGYEWILKSGNSLGLGAYANYSVFNTFKNTTSTEGLFNLTAPTDDSKAILDVQSATKTYANKLGYFDAGIKLAYHFNFPKKRQYKDSKLF